MGRRAGFPASPCAALRGAVADASPSPFIPSNPLGAQLSEVDGRVSRKAPSRWASREKEEHPPPPLRQSHPPAVPALLAAASRLPAPPALPHRCPAAGGAAPGAAGLGARGRRGPGVRAVAGGAGPWDGDGRGGTHTPTPLHAPPHTGAGWRRLFSLAAWRGGPGLSEGLTDLKFRGLNERNTQLTKQCATEEVSSGLAKSLLSFHLFSPNNSCPLIPCYSAVKNKTSL